MSGRNLDRYAKVLQAPLEVQQAVSANKLDLGAAGKVAALKKDQQEEIAAEIRSGRDPKEVVAGYVKKGNGKHKALPDARRSVIRGFETILADLDGRVTEIKRILPEEKATLERVKTMVEQVLSQATVRDEKKEAADRQAIEESMLKHSK